MPASKSRPSDIKGGAVTSPLGEEEIGGTEEIMKRPRISAVVCVACLVLVAGGAFAKKKEKGVAQEHFAATIFPAGQSNSTLSLTIERYSTDEEMKELAQAFTTGGEKALAKALGRMNKGHFRMGDGETKQLLVIQSSSAGAVRRLSMLGYAPTVFSGQLGGQVSIGHRGYDYTYIQLEVDDEGKGTGLLVPFGSVAFGEQGQIVVKPMARQTARLVNVYREK
jgi:hypothetical protein